MKNIPLDDEEMPPLTDDAEAETADDDSLDIEATDEEKW